jgi:diketogulonate reductase-like aldo/keto reductase
MAKKEDVGEAVRYAIEEAGIRHIDTAAEYKACSRFAPSWLCCARA